MISTCKKIDVNGHVHIYSVKADSQAGNIWVCVMLTQKGQNHNILSLGSQRFTPLAEKFSRGPQVQERALRLGIPL